MRKTRGPGRAPLRISELVGLLNRLFLIFKRLILESRGPCRESEFSCLYLRAETELQLSASAASIISFSCLTRAISGLSGSHWSLLGPA